MPPKNLSRLSLFATSAFFLVLQSFAQVHNSPMQHFGETNLDSTLGCVRDVYARPVLWDALDTKLLIQPCPNGREMLETVLGADGIRVFDAQDFIFLIPSRFFRPPSPDLAPYTQALQWNTVKIHLNVQKLEEDEELPLQAHQIAQDLLKNARLIPLALSGLPPKGYPTDGEVDADLNIAIWIGKLDNGNDSVVALVNGRSRPAFSTARLVYGQLRGGKYALLWDSPLFNIQHGDIYFEDVNGDRAKEIIVESTTYGNVIYPILVIFDQNGRELTRQKRCQTRFTPDENYTQDDGVCAIYGSEIALSENEAGPKDIYVRNWNADDRNHVFKLSDGIYVPGPPIEGAFPPPSPIQQWPSAAEFNEQGLKLMRAGDYSSAVAKFMGADRMAVHKNPEYANNVGFALYQAQRYPASIDWLKITIGLDPRRAVAYLNLGDAYVKLNRNAEARQAYLRYLELAPESKPAAEVKKKLDSLPPSP